MRTLLRDRTVLLIVAVALVLRLAAVIWLAHPPSGAPDPTSYWIAGQGIAAGDGYRSIVGQLVSHYPPGYPYFLGVLFLVANALGLEGNAATFIGGVQAVLGAATVLGVMLAAGTWAGRRIAVVAGLLLALWPSQILYPAAILSETWYLFLFVVFLVFLVRVCAGSGPPWLAGAAFFAGASTLVRPQGIVLSLPLLVLAWLVAGVGWRRSLTWGGVILLGVVLVVAPWTYRNYQVYGALVPISTNTWSNLCIGYEPQAPGHFTFAQACLTGESYARGPASELRNEQILAQRVPSMVLEDPGRLPTLALAKLRHTFGLEVDAIDGIEVYGQAPILTDETRSWVYRISAAYYFPLLILAVAGAAVALIQAVRDRRGQVVTWSLLALTVGAVMSPVLFFGDSRFKVPAAPMIALFAGWLLVRAAELATGSERRVPTKGAS